jgi:hypothetical protein
MPKLSEIVGGILRDLAQSHAIADAQTRQVLESYRKDPVLSQFPVPRVTIQQATLKLRFAITEHAPGSADEDPSQYRELWGKALRERVLPGFLEVVGKLDNQAVLKGLQTRLAKLDLENRVDAAQVVDSSKLSQLQDATLTVLLGQAEALPKSVRRYLPDAQALQAAAKQVISREMPEVQRAAEALREANQSARSDLEVAVRLDDLKTVPDSQINEIQLTLALEDVERGGTE